MKCSKIASMILSRILLFAVTINFTGCASKVYAQDLMDGIVAAEVSGKEADEAFIDSQMNLAVKLFKASTAESQQENVLVSPLSILLALAMTTNGAEGQTKSEMETLLGGEISIEELNEYLYSYVNSLPSEDKYKLELANSIWYRDDAYRLYVEETFLQTNADYYGAQAYKAPFDDTTKNDINHWVKEHTDGMIEEIIDEVDEDTVMYLINALVFDAEWQTTYEKSEVYKGSFISANGKEQSVDMMHGAENQYLSNDKVTGFIKPYKDNKYSFAAILPNEGIDINDYIEELTAKELSNLFSNVQTGAVSTTMPKFSYEYEITMNKVLAELGMPTAFDSANADFTEMAQSSLGNIYIGEVLHKTFISVDELGTKAGAVTKVEMKDECAMLTDWEVRLNRPFVYMIIDNATNLPTFIGTVMDVS